MSYQDRSSKFGSDTSIILAALIADLNRAAANDPVFDHFRVIEGNRVAVLVKGEVYTGSVSINLKTQIAHFSLKRLKGRERLELDIPLERKAAPP